MPLWNPFLAVEMKLIKWSSSFKPALKIVWWKRGCGGFDEEVDFWNHAAGLEIELATFDVKPVDLDSQTLYFVFIWILHSVPTFLETDLQKNQQACKRRL